MSDYTTTTHLNLKKPAVGGSSDKWGEYLNSDLDTIDTEIQSLKTASTSRSLESLSNVLDTTPSTGQLLQYDTANWVAATVTIPEDIEDLTNVTVSSPADGQVLAWSTSNSRWENQTPGAATIPDGTITTAKLSTFLQGQVNLILQTTGTPTDDQILRYNSITRNWEFQDLPGGTISALSDTDVSAISNQDVLVYNSTSGDWVSRPLAIADVTGLQASLDAKLESSDLSVSSLTDTTITTTADDSFLVYDASDSKWKNEGPSTARSSLGLTIGTDVQAYDADTTKNDVSNTFSANQIISVSDNTNAALRITQTGTGNALVVEDSSSDSTPFVVDASGRTIIGYTSAINPAQSNGGVQIVGASNICDLNSIRYADSVAGPSLVLAKSRGTVLGTNTIVNLGDQAGAVIFTANDGGGFIQAASIRAYVDGTPGTNDMPGCLVFSTTADGASSPTERMRIDNAGNVGIGTRVLNNNKAVIQGGVAGTKSSTLALKTGSGTSSLVADLSFYSTFYNHLDKTHRRSADITSGYSTGTWNTEYLAFGVGGATDYANLTTERMRIDSSGNVGIGTTSPAQKLDVAGNINATGALTLGTALAIAEGGTGQTTASAARIALLPTLGTAGQVLAVNTGASDVEWVNPVTGSGGGGGTTAYVEHSSTISDSFTLAPGTNRMYIGGTTFSGTISVAGRLAIVAGPANFTGTINTTGTLAIMG